MQATPTQQALSESGTCFAEPPMVRGKTSPVQAPQREAPFVKLTCHFLSALLPLAIALAGCASAAPAAPAVPAKAREEAPAPTPQPTEIEPSGEGLCPALCALRPTYAGLDLPRPRLSFHTTEGEEFDTGKLHGKVIVLHVWGKPQEEIFEDLPQLAKLSQSLGASPDVAVFSVSTDEAPARARQAFKELLDDQHPYEFVVGNDAMSIVSILGPERLPATWIIDQRGVIRARFDGRAPLTQQAQLRALIEGIRSNQSCSIRFDEGQPANGACDPAPLARTSATALGEAAHLRRGLAVGCKDRDAPGHRTRLALVPPPLSAHRRLHGPVGAPLGRQDDHAQGDRAERPPLRDEDPRRRERHGAGVGGAV